MTRWKRPWSVWLGLASVTVEQKSESGESLTMGATFHGPSAIEKYNNGK